MKKHLLLTVLLFCYAFLARAQQDSSIIWINTASGNIFTYDVNECTAQFYCSTGKEFLDIALTPNGNLWGNTQDSLFQIFSNGSTIPIGKIPASAALVGLNDTTLLIDSMTYLLAVKTTDVSTKNLGCISYNADGDLTWLGKDLYMVGGSHLIKITLNDEYSAVQDVDSILLSAASNAYYTPGLATAYLYPFGYNLIALIGNVEIYSIDTSNGYYTEICSNSTAADTSYGAASMIFPPKPQESAIQEVPFKNIQISVYPNPTNANVYISLDDFNGKYSELNISFYDINGIKLKSLQMNSKKERIELKDFVQGIYLIKIMHKEICIYETTIIKL